MKSTVELMNVKGVKVPNFKEPKGVEFEKVMGDIYVKVERLRQLKNSSIQQINKCKDELNSLKYSIVMCDDPFIELELKKRRKELQEELESIDDYSELDLQEYSDKLLKDPKVRKLFNEAAEENKQKRIEIKQYQEEITRQYQRSMKETQRFAADTGSDASYSAGLRVYNKFV